MNAIFPAPVTAFDPNVPVSKLMSDGESDR